MSDGVCYNLELDVCKLIQFSGAVLHLAVLEQVFRSSDNGIVERSFLPINNSAGVYPF